MLGVPVTEIDAVPMRMRMEALAYAKVMEKVKPFLEEETSRRVRTKQEERAMMEKAKSSPKGRR